jgi:aryl-alcohol dehydrogenase-like predicted oxidoreductase
MGFGARWVTLAGPEGSRDLLHRAVELGVRLIDTADVYGGGGSEELIAAALHPYPPDVVVATKGGQVAGPDGQPRPDCRPEYLREACEASLRRLRVDTIDLYQLHNPDLEIPLEEQLGALAELQAEGKVRQIGVSNISGAWLENVLTFASIVSVQNLYSLHKRRFEQDLDICERHGLAFMPYFPLGAGALAVSDGALAEVATARGVTPAQAALAWLLGHSPAMLPIPGTASIAHLEENVAAAAIELTAEEVSRLEADPAT